MNEAGHTRAVETHKRQGKRNDLLTATSVEIQQKSTTRETVAGFFGVKLYDIQRDVRITFLICSLQDTVDERHLNLMCGVAISYYDEETQKLFLERLKIDHTDYVDCKAFHRLQEEAVYNVPGMVGVSYIFNNTGVAYFYSARYDDAMQFINCMNQIRQHITFPSIVVAQG